MARKMLVEMRLENIGDDIQEDEVELVSDEETDEEHGVACDRDDKDHDDIIESMIPRLGQ
ncbi:hypothetical protein QJS10_CPB19g01370 [Acorus calamus]|uniref:Uncharacterized protein n=1 Tax=Acorus calamus TaxID=4465 RepID=A0AAV9CGY8_ACOCL|nr:hypothetical protein QJS10_CPB19g01370 [Acorus calamus]